MIKQIFILFCDEVINFEATDYGKNIFIHINSKKFKPAGYKKQV